MPDNLTVSIGADTSKLRAELKLAKEQLKELGRQVSGAVKRGDVAAAGDLSRQYGTLETRVVGLNRSLRGTASALDQVTAAGARTEGQFRRIGVSANSIGRLVSGFGGGAAGGFASFAAIKGIEAFVSAITDATEALTKIRDLSREIGQKPLVTQAATELAKETGASAEQATKFLQGMSAAITKVATTKREQTVFQGVTLQRPPAQPPTAADSLRDFSDPLKIIGITNKEAFSLKPAEEQQRLLAEAFIRTFNNAKKLGLSLTQLNAVAKDIFNNDAQTSMEIATALIAGMDKKVNDLADSERGATAARLKQLRALKEAQARSSTAADETGATIANAARGAQVEWNNLLTSINNVAQSLIKTQTPAKGLPAANLLGDPETPIVDTERSFSSMLPYLQTLATKIGEIFTFMFKHISIEAMAATNDIKTATTIALDDVNVTAKAMKTAADVYVGRGGTGFPSPYGPVDTGAYGYGPRGSGFREEASPARGGDPSRGGTSPYLQSYAPGMSNYQALPPHMVEPIKESAAQGWGMAAKTAAEASADAAAASRSAAEASKTAADAWVDQSRSTGLPGYAGGGMISGPGTPTSDSIMARLSNGEFVMRAAAVDALGPRFLASLNALRNPFAGFAAGGLVGRGFADGGMLMAGAGGTPVHLHLGGHSFALSGAGGVVDALVVEANRQHIRSAGVKPSWYGGRPGGH